MRTLDETRAGKSTRVVGVEVSYIVVMIRHKRPRGYSNYSMQVYRVGQQVRSVPVCERMCQAGTQGVGSGKRNRGVV
jgi:hypothetical protein